VLLIRNIEDFLPLHQRVGSMATAGSCEESTNLVAGFDAKMPQPGDRQIFPKQTIKNFYRHNV
jgi:hypothetical protein